ncbi:S8 family serine peptidase, partial [Algoriphagus sp. A40]|uniref:S8 family peptidase n=1 Tax=Algoriphagus sp. A40 TaxID=1945863 RepID=UPI0009C4FC00
SYIIDLKEDRFVPILKEYEESDFENDKEKLDQVEKEKIENIQRYASKFDLNVDPEDIFIYTSSGFLVRNIDPSKLKKLRKDTKNISSIQQNFTMQDIRARMQSIGPLPQNIRARMQGPNPGLEDIRARMQEWGYDTTKFTSKGILTVGGGENPVTTNRKIWIVDSGIDGNHHDFTGQLGSTLHKSWVETSPDELNPLIDFIGHGTHGAGAAAGRAYNQTQPNSSELIGMNGVSPGAQLVSLKVFANDRTSEWAWFLEALEYAGKKAKKGDVISLSLGGYGSCTDTTLNKTLKYLSKKKLFVVMAAGNGVDGVGVNVNGFLPACVDGLEGVYTIGSVRQDFLFPNFPFSFSVFSNFGTQLDWMVPGELIFSTYPGNNYSVSSGTSVATAMVAGIIHANGGPPIEFATVVGPPGTKTYNIGRRKTQ